MSRTELERVATMTGLRKEAIACLSEGELRDRTLSWMAQVVGCKSSAREEIERAVLLWLRDRLNLDLQVDDSDVNALEDAIFTRVVESAAGPLIPVWKVAAAMAAMAPPRIKGDETRLLEGVATRMLGSAAVLARMRQEWQHLLDQPARDPQELMRYLQPEVQRLQAHPEFIGPALTLCLVLALADAKFDKAEEQLYNTVAAALRVEPEDANTLKDQVGRTFWKLRTQIAPPNTEPPEEARKNSLRAALMTLEETALIEGLHEEVRRAYLSGICESLFADPEFSKGARQWRKAPLAWPLGFGLGLLQFFKGRLAGDDHRRLAYVLHLAHTRQTT